MAYGTSFLRGETVYLPQAPDIPVHALYTDTDGGAVAAYVLYSDGEFVADPLWFQLRTAVRLLVEGRRPMTLFFVHDVSAPPNPSLAALPAVTLLFDAIDAFLP